MNSPHDENEGSLRHDQEEKSIICKTTNGLLVIDYYARRASLASKEIRLTDIEFRLLWELVSKEGKTIPYSELLTNVWGGSTKRKRTTFITTFDFYVRN